MAKKAVRKSSGKTSQSPAGDGKTPARAKRKTAARPAGSEPLTHTLDALLHTMRCIAQHEDELCTLLHAARRSGRMSASLLRDLQSILSELPADEYTDDLRAVQELASAA